MYAVSAEQKRTGGQLLIDSLLANDVDTIFCVAGESYLAALDALYDARDQITLISCRHESGATFMAEAYGKLTGKPGICFVTRGPGACNASIGVHTAFQDQTPLILFVGQVARDVLGREGFQEVDFTQMFAPVAKGAVQIMDAGAIPETMEVIFSNAINGRRGPIVVSLPEDVLTDTASVSGRPPIGKIAVHAPAKNQIQDLQTLLESAKKPLVILGGGGWTEHAVQSFQKFAENNALPVACAFRRQDLIDNTSASYAGDLGYGADPALVKRLSEADLIFAVGDRLGEVTSREYTVWTIPQMQAKLIHVYPDRKELGRVYKPDLAIAAEMNVFADAVKDVKCKVSWQDWTKSLRADYEKTLTPTPVSGPLDFAQIMKYLNDVLPKNSIMTNDAGNFSGWLHRYYQWRQYPTQAAPCNGAMGYAVPSAVAAAIAFPDRMVLGFAGDGGFLMTASEIATAIQYKAKPILIVVNNNMYGTIRMHQEKNYPGRISGTELTNPDFAALARSYGAFGATVKKTEEFIPAFIEAQKAGKCAVIEIQLDAEIISTRTTLSAVRKAAMDTKK